MSVSLRESYDSAMQAYIDEFYSANLLVKYSDEMDYEEWLAMQAEEEAEELAKHIPQSTTTTKTRSL
jgi:hypothetical protein